MLSEVTNIDEFNNSSIGTKSPHTVELNKDDQGRIGIGIGGGIGANCPCLYIVQIFEGTSASREKLIELGDEIVAVNGKLTFNKDKMKVATEIRESDSRVRLSIRKLDLMVDQNQFFDLDITVKRLKHKLVDSIDDTMADTLGLSRAVLLNDKIKKFQTLLDSSENFYKTFVCKLTFLLNSYKDQARNCGEIGCMFISIYDKAHPEKCLLRELGKHHMLLKEENDNYISSVSRIAENIRNHLEKSIPDVKESVRIYLDAKYDYLSFCLRVKEMEDDETVIISSGEELERMKDGNIEYRSNSWHID